MVVSFSFFVNVKFIFKVLIIMMCYMLYVGFMGILSVIVGWAVDRCVFFLMIIFVIFFVISLVCGFVYLKFIVFRDVK